MLKMEIRSFTIYYCRQNAKTKKAEEAVLQQKLSSRQKLMCENPTQETTGNYYEIKMKLEQISLHKTEGAMIRSKARYVILITHDNHSRLCPAFCKKK